MKNLLLLLMGVLLMSACGGSDESTADTSGPPPQSMIADAPADDGKGVGEIKDVSLNSPLDAAMVDKGSAIFDMKCAACHKLTDQRVVGPGWKGLTDRRKPEWIMNMIMNVDVMLDKDPAAQALLKECLVRMPNQNLTMEDARSVLEFAYANDGQAVGK
ncbi:MAG: c-type cytochrome [Saprospiraceae bacterium]|nr:c-type cytochrome [Saprospiraceae bacterium]